MKVEYVRSTFGIGPDMLISGTEFLKAFDDNGEEYDYLRFAVDGFAKTHGYKNNLKPRDYYTAKGWLEKGSAVLFVTKEYEFRYNQFVRWCEIYVITSGKIINVITSQDGEQFDVNVNHNKVSSKPREKGGVKK